MADEKRKGLWARITGILSVLWSPVSTAGTSVAQRFDPVAQAAKLPEIKAAARSWRTKVASAPVGTTRLLDPGVVLKEAPSSAELDASEAALVMEFARAKTYCADAPLWTPTGLEVWYYLHCAAKEAGMLKKVDTFGYLSRMRIMPTRVDHEVGTRYSDYRNGNWVNVWTKGEAA